MDLPALLQQYGYAAVFVGAFLEGETVLILAGYAAHRGYLDLTTVIGVAFVASILGDQLFYFLGRHWGAQILAHAPHWHARADSFRDLLHRHHVPLILSLRFLYGLRTVGAVVIGMSGVRPLRFVALNIVSAGVWAVTVGLAGYLFGRVIELLLRDLREYEWWVAAAIALAGFIFWFVRRRLADARLRSGEP